MKTIIAIGLICLIIISMGIYTVAEDMQVIPMVVDNPFRLDGNGELGAEADSGTGAWDDPWIIENREIDSFGSDYGIYIGNTTEHFIIRNCTINGTSESANHPFYVSTGIHLYNTDNGNLTNNTIYECETYGIFISNGSYNCSAYDNLLWNNTLRGISIDFSDLIYTVANYIYGNQTTLFGIAFNGYSDHQYVAGNYIHQPVIIGIGFNDSWNVSMIDNEIIGYLLDDPPDPIGFPAWGIYVHFSYWVDITSNNLTDCVNGIFMTGSNSEESMHNTISSNLLDGCWYTGITLSYSVNVSVGYNDLNNSNNDTTDALDYGICIFQYVNETNVFSNTIENYGTGINITTANNSDVTLWNNHLSNNTINAWSEATYGNCPFNKLLVGNWWDDWLYPDADTNGIVDDQYDIDGSGNNYDPYPRVTVSSESSTGDGGTSGTPLSPPPTVPDTEVTEPGPFDNLCTGTILEISLITIPGLVLIIKKKKPFKISKLRR